MVQDPSTPDTGSALYQSQWWALAACLLAGARLGQIASRIYCQPFWSDGQKTLSTVGGLWLCSFPGYGQTRFKGQMHIRWICTLLSSPVVVSHQPGSVDKQRCQLWSLLGHCRYEFHLSQSMCWLLHAPSPFITVQLLVVKPCRFPCNPSGAD